MYRMKATLERDPMPENMNLTRAQLAVYWLTAEDYESECVQTNGWPRIGEQIETSEETKEDE
jgi:hypothetical protein